METKPVGAPDRFGIGVQLVPGTLDSLLPRTVDEFFTTPGWLNCTRAASTCSGSAFGLNPRISAATPATWGAAIDVPESATGLVKFLASAEVIEDPGANRSTHSPKFENDERLSN